MGGVEDGGGYCTGNTIAFHPTNSSLLYVGGSYYDYVAQTTYMAVGKSTDQGGSWTFAYPSADYGDVYALAIDPNNSETVYAGTDGGAYISYDAGTMWGQVNDGLLGATVVYSIAVDSESNVYAATPYGIFKLEGN